MKRLEVTVTKNQVDDVREVLKSLELSYTYSSVKIGDEACGAFSCLIPDKLVDNAIEELLKVIDTRLKENTLSVYNVEAHISSHVDRVAKKVLEEAPPANPFERLVETAEKFTNITAELLFMALFATLIAVVGLFLDNPVTVIGAMLLSPLLGPINAFAVNACIGKVKKLVRIEASIIILVVSAIALSAVITYFASLFFDLPITSQINLRSQTTLIDIAIGLIIGLAGGLALASALPQMLVGVSVASAILPPAAVSGIGLALMDAGLFSGALMLTLVYVVGLELGGTIMLRVKGVRPRRFYQQSEARRHSIYFFVTFSLLLLILVIIVYTSG